MPALLRKFICLGILLLVLFVGSSVSVSAAEVTPTLNPNQPTNLTTCANYKPVWKPDTEVTMVGKAAERSRQLLYWVLSKEHQPVNNAPALIEIWSFSRNLVYIFVVLVIVAFGFSYIFLKRRAMSIDIPPIIAKIGAILLYATFSYVLVLGFIQGSEILMRFFIERVGGQNLFNIIFSGVSRESNYIDFIGYRDVSFCAQESGKTALFLVNLTNITYNIMAIMLILRNIILWFLLVLSPFLALLMPFIFIRNVGWIWIGVFFQWLFYGPLFALFLSGITKIWVRGIPYAFDFQRVDQPAGQVYRTAINILYGGPAQTLGPGNSANYIDTYAEYVIALVMLWAAIILPWLLLRIFRDYCCAAIAASANTLSAIFDRLRQYPPPEKPLPSMPAPTTTSGLAFELPFRKTIADMKKQQNEALADVSNKAQAEAFRDISRAATDQIASSMNMSVSSLSDLSRLEMNRTKTSDIRSTLNKIGNPQNITSPAEREKFVGLRSELVNRASHGDNMAQSILSASSSDHKEQIMAVPTIGGLRTQGIPQMGVAGQKVTGAKAIPLKAGKGTPAVSVEEYEEVKKMWLNHYREAPVPVTDKIKDRTKWLTEDIKSLTNTVNLLSSANPAQKQKGLEEVAAILPFLLLGGFSEVETVMYLRAKLEAAKQAQSELEVAEKAKEEIKKTENEETETLVSVEEKKDADREKTMEEKAQMTLDSDQDKLNDNVQNKEELPVIDSSGKTDLSKKDKKS